MQATEFWLMNICYYMTWFMLQTVAKHKLWIHHNKAII